MASRTIEEAVTLCYLGVKGGAAKRGRNPRWPYVPVVVFPDRSDLGGFSKGYTQQILRRAYATREEAVALAEKQIALWRTDMARKLADPKYGPFRKQWSVEL